MQDKTELRKRLFPTLVSRDLILNTQEVWDSHSAKIEVVCDVVFDNNGKIVSVSNISGPSTIAVNVESARTVPLGEYPTSEWNHYQFHLDWARVEWVQNKHPQFQLEIGGLLLFYEVEYHQDPLVEELLGLGRLSIGKIVLKIKNLE